MDFVVSSDHTDSVGKGSQSSNAALLRSNISNLSKGIAQAVGEFANQVFAANLITQANCHDAQNSSKDACQRSSALLHILLNRVEVNPSEFYLILDILKSMPCMKSVVTIMETAETVAATVSR